MSASGAWVEGDVEAWLERRFVACEDCGRVTADYHVVEQWNGSDGGVEAVCYCRACWGRDDECVAT